MEREGLAVVYSVKKFHQYIYGIQFEIWTDHKPLLGIIGETKPIPERAAARIQRWALLLSAYNYVLKYRKGEKHGNADGMSRLPMIAYANEVSDVENEIYMTMLDHAPVNSKEVKDFTRKDVVLSRVCDFILSGFPEDFEAEGEFVPYVKRRDELSVEDGCVLWGNRVVIPLKLRERVLEELHEGHIGMSRMKMLGRAFVWWPGLDEDIQKTCSECEACVMHQNNPDQAGTHPWETPNKPWERLHIDYAGPYLGKMFLIVTDVYSKWLEVYVVPSANSLSTIEKLRVAFSAHGIPEVIVSDNGSPFTSQEFSQFTKRNGISHVFSAPYHPSSNGAAERTVQTFKKFMGKQDLGRCSIETLVSRFLFSYRNTPHSRTGVTPAELLMSRKPRTLLTSIKPDFYARSKKNSAAMAGKGPTRQFAVGDAVLARNYGGGNKWVKGVVSEKVGPVSYKIRINGGVIRRHIDQVVRNSLTTDPTVELDNQVIPDDDVSEFSGRTPNLQVSEAPTPTPVVLPGSPTTEVPVIVEESPSTGDVTTGTVGAPLRRSAREKKSPAWLGDYKTS